MGNCFQYLITRIIYLVGAINYIYLQIELK